MDDGQRVRMANGRFDITYTDGWKLWTMGQRERRGRRTDVAGFICRDFASFFDGPFRVLMMTAACTGDGIKDGHAGENQCIGS